MLIFRLILPVLLALLAWWGLLQLKKRYALTASGFRWLLGITATLLVVLTLIIMGRLPVQALLAPLLFLLSFMLRNASLLARLWPLFRMGRSKWGSQNSWGKGTGNASGSSSIRTAWLDMGLDHHSGSMEGEVLQGQFKGQLLSAMGMSQLLALASECRRDADSLQLLEAYLDRMHPDWRAEPDADSGSDTAGNARVSSDAQMTQSLALEILGLEASAGKDEIVAAHRRLMQRLHPDRGGSDYLAQRINAARDFLLERQSQ